MVTDKGFYLEYYDKTSTDERVEDWHQCQSATWLRVNHADLLFWHSVNEGKKHIHSALRDEQAGLLKGVSDFVILIGLSRPGCKYQFAAIELKRAKKSGKGKASPVSEAQRDFLKAVRDRGGFAAVAYGYEELKKAVADMLNSTNS